MTPAPNPSMQSKPREEKRRVSSTIAAPRAVIPHVKSPASPAYSTHVPREVKFIKESPRFSALMQVHSSGYAAGKRLVTWGPIHPLGAGMHTRKSLSRQMRGRGGLRPGEKRRGCLWFPIPLACSAPARNFSPALVRRRRMWYNQCLAPTGAKLQNRKQKHDVCILAPNASTVAGRDQERLCLPHAHPGGQAIPLVLAGTGCAWAVPKRARAKPRPLPCPFCKTFPAARYGPAHPGPSAP